MSDQHWTYKIVGKGYRAHQWVHHGEKEFARGDVHNNTAESFNALLERAKQGVFHYLSKEHLQRYLHEFEFRWNQRMPEMKLTRNISKDLFKNRLTCVALLATVSYDQKLQA